MSKQQRKLFCCHDYVSLSVAVMSILICDSLLTFIYVGMCAWGIGYTHTYVISLWCLQNFKMQNFEKNSYARMPTCLIIYNSLS